MRLIGVATGVLSGIGLKIDPKKTNIFRKGRRQRCTGLVVNAQVSVARTVRRKLRAAVHAAETGKELTGNGKPMTLSSLLGRLSFLQMVHPEEALELKGRLARLEKTAPSPGCWSVPRGT